MRKNIVAGNWKMNLSFEKALQIAREVSHETIPENTEVILGAPFPYLKPIIDMLIHVPNVSVSAQNCHENVDGAFTGEVSAKMLTSISCPTVILGHSERRQYNNESNQILKHKVNTALQFEMKIIFCCGENLGIRKSGKAEQFVTQQLFESLFHLAPGWWKYITLAYEPIWAIGTGETASAEQAESMHAHIRQFIKNKYGENIANEISILYGGSVKPNNASELFGQPNIDGGLIGGASLSSDSFIEILHSFT